MDTYRQGDVLLHRVDTLPEGATKVLAQTRIVLAYGEVTGHAHVIDAEQAEEYQTPSKHGVQRHLRVKHLAQVNHEEHASVPLPAGIYEIVQQCEYTPTEIKHVID